MSVVYNSSLYQGSVSETMIYMISQGVGLQWGEHMRTDVLMDGKPRELTSVSQSEKPLMKNIKNPRSQNYENSPAVTTFNSRYLSVEELIFLENYDINEFKETFPAYQPKGLEIDLQKNMLITNAVLSSIMPSIMTHLNDLHTIGDKSLAESTRLDFYDGLTTLILKSGSGATQVGTPAVLTTDNIIDSFFALRKAIPPRLRNQNNLKIFCSYSDADDFDQAARKTQDARVITELKGIRSITSADGSTIPVIANQSIPKNFVILTPCGKDKSSNLVQGVWMTKDKDSMAMYREQRVDQIYRIAARMSAGVQFVSGKDIFYLNNV